MGQFAQTAGNYLLADPSRLLGWAGRFVQEMFPQYKLAGQALGMAGATLELSPGKAYGGIVGGNMGATLGRAFGPVGGIIGGVAGGYVGGVVGGWLDPPVEWPDPWS